MDVTGVIFVIVVSFDELTVDDVIGARVDVGSSMGSTSEVLVVSSAVEIVGASLVVTGDSDARLGGRFRLRG